MLQQEIERWETSWCSWQRVFPGLLIDNWVGDSKQSPGTAARCCCIGVFLTLFYFLHLFAQSGAVCTDHSGFPPVLSSVLPTDLSGKCTWKAWPSMPLWYAFYYEEEWLFLVMVFMFPSGNSISQIYSGEVIQPLLPSTQFLHAVKSQTLCIQKHHLLFILFSVILRVLLTCSSATPKATALCLLLVCQWLVQMQIVKAVLMSHMSYYLGRKHNLT